MELEQTASPVPLLHPAMMVIGQYRGPRLSDFAFFSTNYLDEAIKETTAFIAAATWDWPGSTPWGPAGRRDRIMTPFTGRVPPAVPKPEPAAAPAPANRSPVRRRGNTLERWEIALIKAMIADGRWPNDQDILAHFTRPTRSVNHRAIAEIRTKKKHTAVKPAAAEDLDAFLGLLARR